MTSSLTDAFIDELKFVVEPQINPCRGPLYITRSLTSADGVIANAGFGLVDTGQKKLLITCQHVWEAFQEQRRKDSKVRMCVCLDNKSLVVFDQHEPIDLDSKLDIATFDIAPVLGACSGGKFYPLQQNPAPRLVKGDKIVLVGYQGIFRSATAEGLVFRATTYACEVSDVSGLHMVADFSKAITKYASKPVRAPEANTSPHGGISGSPCFLVRGHRPVLLVGFVTDDWKQSLWFTHARCLNANGTLNRMAT